MRLNLNYGAARRIRHLGIFAFSFFLIKGLAWIMVPVFIGSTISSCGAPESGAEVTHE